MTVAFSQTESEIRQELKFAVPVSMLQRTKMLMLSHPALLTSPFPERRINNLYFDDVVFTRFQSTVGTPSSNSKLRLRWYGDEQAQVVILQIKVTRQRHKAKYQQVLSLPAPLATMHYSELLAFLHEKASPQFQRELLRGDRPVLSNSYQRKYYANELNKIRFTIDYEMRVYNQLERQSLCIPWQEPGKLAVVELKTPSTPDITINNLLKHFDVRLETGSKYKEAMAKIILRYQQ